MLTFDVEGAPELPSLIFRYDNSRNVPLALLPVGLAYVYYKKK